MKNLYDKYRRIINLTSMKLVRGYTDRINWDTPLLSLRGQKGVGKSTIMLQYIKQHYDIADRSVLYCTCDSAYFASHSLLTLADSFYKNGGKHLFLDEIHKYEGWSSEIKEIYDSYPDLRVVISGSSLLKLMQGDADLSRRCINYDIQGLSFREFLNFYHGIDIRKYDLDEILTNPWELCEQINQACRPIALFHEYLQFGYYPYYLKLKNKIDYYTAIEQVVNYVIDEELTRICRVEMSNTRKIKALINVLAAQQPFEVDIKSFATQSALQRNTILEYLNHMHNANLLHLLYADLLNVKKMQKPDKIYLDNSNMLYAMSPEQVKIGTVRETFAVNQLAFNHKVEYAKDHGDFRVDNKYVFEIGGAGKDFHQIAGIPNSFVLADDTEFPDGNKLPLWIIGFLY